ncbi:MAG: T9SS type A sorting domain-containing protein [Bacteroidia bacterium]|nr:T9SS type A sorting domain-containing protein [Bacteroidia bacterium]
MKYIFKFFIGSLVCCCLQLHFVFAQEISPCQLNKHKPAATKVYGNTGDTIHIAHYNIFIDTINYTAKSIVAHTQLTVVCKQNNVSSIPLDLLKLTVDSVVGTNVSGFTCNDTVLRINVVTPLMAGDTTIVTVYYNGNPKQDASGWGGFYFSGSYVFNLGVGFASNPHNVGKMWYPCIDNFTDRATYNFYINTPANAKAFCNGTLQNTLTLPDGRKQWHWHQPQTIPTYLVCMAVAPFYTLQQNINGIPVELALLPNDTANALISFQHLPQVLNGFINAYGPYPFDKVGYSMVPFNSGAMEHASQITIGAAYINGLLNYETLWAHELAHMWWGDKVTCETAGDMWLNEGWASYNEAFMKEVVYGQTAYKDWIRNNHRKVLQFAHIEDGSYLPFVNVPHAYTYGTTVYKKGADAVHTLRNYMGDSAFFNGCKYHLNTLAYNHSNSYNLRDNLTQSSGINMQRFFDDWVFTPGFPHFSIDSVQTSNSGSINYQLYLRQRSKGNNHIYKMPVDLRFTDGINDTTVTVICDSNLNTFTVVLPFNATWIAVDRAEKISDAISDFEVNVNNTGAVLMPETNVKLNVTHAGSATNTVRIEHHWVAPDGFKMQAPGIKISDYHYWKADGLWSNGFLTKAEFSYNGSNSGTLGYIDNSFITASEDSLVLLYRSNTATDWQIVTGVTFNYGANKTDKVGSATCDTLLKGEYAWGLRDYTVSLINDIETKPILKIAPNPAGVSCEITFDKLMNGKGLLQIFNSKGICVAQHDVFQHQPFIKQDLSQWPAGVYHVVLISGKKQVTESLLVNDN